ncbi:flagellar hook assembly protein FlgD [Desulfovibrio sp. JC010]|uniref:flagellar hook assembly protein FlgD n=1 Tax=Desulfovibrio sp. JC010 TaxID=2593641 RepID=UPI0013D3AC63|nr:flagellar hook capping FlgD N-terminal domain-containing protein [Desulfovibrio sp. JC010]NDV26765.1 flagellar hook assembly protein FlgD [Desulfovibrio sp. JC010]
MIDATTYLNNVTRNDKPKTPSKELGKDAFLKLFVTQLKNQDPVNPMKEKEQLAQLAQFSSLERLTNISKAMEGLAKTVNTVIGLTSTGYIGKTVMAKGFSVSKKGAETTSASINLPVACKSVYVDVFDKKGALVRSVEMGSKNAGKFDFKWDGKDKDGKAADDGQYRIVVRAEAPSGKKVLANIEVSGKVKAINTAGGQHVLELEDGRKVLLSNVTRVVA